MVSVGRPPRFVEAEPGPLPGIAHGAPLRDVPGFGEHRDVRGALLRPLWMLDLSADSVLAGQDDAVRAVNAEQTRKIVGSSSAVRTAWQPGPECDDFGIPPAAELS
jgi:hypothetical protein